MRTWKREEKMCHVQTDQNVSYIFCLTSSSDSVPGPIIPVTSFAGSVELASHPENELGNHGNEIQASM
jgi:hypothetical protein